MKKYVLFMLLMTFTFALAACTQSEEEKIQAYLKDKSEIFYHFSVVDFTDEKLNIEFTMLPNSETWSNDAAESDVSIETKASLEAIKNYSKKYLGVIKEVNLYFVMRETNKVVAEINANNDTILETDWKDVSNRELSQIVDGYKFYGVSN
ncbi:hypothetical protein I2483_17945 [Sporosarcina sp. E16_3]|uniref:hypothetical protein n=1 Tax=unclassified Sporosarcina TaxID=2647733 RepID=UPI0016457226|nr:MULTISPECIES: hypothetical protein [unclassified Sporosarcina]MBO0603550.1 hypothetical protein [Sporosarcina sp. E16_3]